MFNLNLSAIDFANYSAVSNAIDAIESALESCYITLDGARECVLEMLDHMSDLSLDDMPSTVGEMAEAFKPLKSSASYYAAQIEERDEINERALLAYEASVPEIVYFAL